MSRPRIRTIKPELWEDESVGRLGPWERLLFIGAITMADDEGRFRALPSTIVGQLFPYEAHSPGKVRRWLASLEREKLLALYESDGVQYAEVRGWAKHQRVEKGNPSALPPGPFADSSGIHPGFIRDKSRASRASRSDPRSGPDPSVQFRARARALAEYWRQKCGHPRAVLDAKRLRAAEARLREGASDDEVRTAIDGAARAAYVDDSGVKHDDLALICRSREKLDLFIARATATPGSPSRTNAKSDHSKYDARMVEA